MPPRQFARTPLVVAILRLVQERPMHPYELQRVIRDRYLDSVVKLPRGSLYHTIGRLEKAGLLEAVETERPGRRPERTIYRVTELGAERLETSLRELLGTPEWPPYPPFAVGLAFLDSLEPDEARAELERRKVELEVLMAAYDAVERHAGRTRAELIPHEYLQAMRKAEMAYIEKLIDELGG